MMNKLKTLVAAFIAVLSTCSLCMAAESTQRVETMDGFSLNLPANWKAIPKDVLDSYSDAVAKMAPGAESRFTTAASNYRNRGIGLNIPTSLFKLRKQEEYPKVSLSLSSR